MAAPILLGSKIIPGLKLAWGRPQLEQGRWRLGLFTFYSAKRGFPRSGFAINVRAVLGWALVMGVAGYLALAAVFTQWFRGQPHNRVGFTDVLTWPVRRAKMADLRGRAWLAQGKDAIAARRWGEGVFYLRKGLEVCPDDQDAQLALAQFYLLVGQRLSAMEIFVAGPQHGVPSPAWLEMVFQVTTAGEDWGTLLEICDACLAMPPASYSREVRAQLISRKSEALIGLGRAQEALTLTEAEGSDADPAVKTHHATALLALGRTDEALVYLAQWYPSAARADRIIIQQLRVRALRESGRLDEMERELEAIAAANPTHAPIAAFGVEQRARAGRKASAALDDYVFRFGGTDAKLRFVARLLADIPDVPLTRRVAAEAAARGYLPFPYDACVATALLRAGDWAGLGRAMQEMAPHFADAKGDRLLWYNWLQVLTDDLTVLPAGTKPATLDYLANHLVSIEAHQLTVAALRGAGRLEAARDLLTISRRFYPGSLSLRESQAAVARELTARPVAVAAAVAPAASTPLEAKDFFQPLDAAIAAQNWPAAREMIDRVRANRTPAGWLAASDTELLRRDLRINQALGDTPALQLTARLLLNAGPAKADAVLAFARELDARGAKADAMLLTRTVLAKYPDNAAATDLVDAWAVRDAK